MRGNLIWEYGKVRFTEDADGEYEVVDGGRITQRHDMKFAIENFGKPHWSDEGQREFRRLRDEQLLHGKTQQPTKSEDNLPEYQIQEFRNKDDHKIIYKHDSQLKGKYVAEDGCAPFFEVKNFLSMPEYEIFKVKRTSDSQEFTVDEITEQGKIIEFDPADVPFNVHCSHGYYKLSELTKKKDSQQNPEYTITAFKDKRNGNVLREGERDFFMGYTRTSHLDTKKIIDDGNFEIYSVLRNSDSQTFTVDETTEQGRIKEFYFAPYGQFFGVGDGKCGETIGAHTKSGSWHISVLTKKKERQALFTTDDGVEIYRGDRYWFIYPQWLVGEAVCLGRKMEGALGTFATKEKAEEYILLNKPILSLKEILNGEMFAWRVDIKEKLIAAAKEKMKA